MLGLAAGEYAQSVAGALRGLPVVRAGFTRRLREAVAHAPQIYVVVATLLLGRESAVANQLAHASVAYSKHLGRFARWHQLPLELISADTATSTPFPVFSASKDGGGSSRPLSDFNLTEKERLEALFSFQPAILWSQ